MGCVSIRIRFGCIHRKSSMRVLIEIDFLSYSWHLELGSTGKIRSFITQSLMIPNGSLSSPSHIQTPGRKYEDGQKGKLIFCWLRSVPLSTLSKRDKTISFYILLTESQSHVTFWLYLLPGSLKCVVFYFCHNVCG